ncbi:MAG: tetratricopeptide repeat protein, partial [Phycisphaerae bacterium]|nr:tetratricopeptide repeat protein [Phycisphaerae bacterium]
MAKSPSDYQMAIDEFKKAIAIAPQWGDVYYNLGMVQEKGQRYAEAIESFRKYLKLSPNAADTGTVKSMINKIEFRQEFQAKQQKLSGVWVESDGTPFQISMDGNSIELKTNRRNLSGDVDEYYGPGVGAMSVPTSAVETIAFHLERKADTLSGTWESKETQIEQCTVPKQGGSVEGTLQEKEGRIILQIQRPKLKVFYASPFPFSFETADKCQEVSVIAQRNLTLVFDGPLAPGGIGADVSTVFVPGLIMPEYGWTGHLTISALLPESKAAAAGLMSQDEIIAIDTVLVSSMKGNEAFRRLHGEVGSEIELSVKREDVKEPIKIRFPRVPVSTEFPKDLQTCWVN